MNDMRKLINLVESVGKPRELVRFNEPVAKDAVNSINRKMQEWGQENRAFLVDPHTIEVETPSGVEVDIINSTIDDLGGGVYDALEEELDDDGDVQSVHRTDEEFYSDILKLTEEGMAAYDSLESENSADSMATVLQDIDNIVRLRASGRPYAPIHEKKED